MPTDIDEYEPGVLRIFQSKDETKAYYNKIAKFYDLLADRPGATHTGWSRACRIADCESDSESLIEADSVP